MRFTVISKNINKSEINMVVVHSLDDAYKEAQNAIDNGFDKAVIEDEVHNTIFSCVKSKETNFDRITKSPEALAEYIVSLEYDKEDFPNSYKEDYDNLLEWLKQESKE